MLCVCDNCSLNPILMIYELYTYLIELSDDTAIKRRLCINLCNILY